jgi:hypothetical protein
MRDAMRPGGASGGASGEGGAAAAPAKSVADQLRDLAALHKEGILTAEEYAAKKAELVKRL